VVQGGSPPSAPQNVTAKNQCAGVVLAWQAPANNGGSPIVAYKIYRGGYRTETFLATTTNLTFTDSTGGSWTWNYYRITAVNAAGMESAPTADLGGFKTC